jgi:hypothetical protein
VFGRRKREEQAAAEAVREGERRALFERLAVRPENICPFLGLEGERAGYVDGVSEEHRCFAFGDPMSLSAEQQTRVCQERGYGNCPRYLRGVLVIPTEELEALRQRRVPEPPPPPPPPVRQAPIAPPPPPIEDDTGGRFPAILWVGLLLLVVAIASIGAYLFRDNLGIAGASQEPTARATPVASATAEPTPVPTPLPTAPPKAWGWVGCTPDEEPCASEDVNRAEMALYLSRAFGLAEELGEDEFTDISDNEYRGQINAVAIEGLTVGCTATEYCPDGLVTREQMATFIQRAFDVPDTDQDFFTDDNGSTHEDAINAVTAASIMEGCRGDSFCPRQTVTRGETAAYLHRAQSPE